MTNSIRCIPFLLLILSLAGCKEVLYSDLPEVQANEMVAVLASAGIESSRERDKNNIYTVSVEEGQVAAAVTILKNHGLPRETYQSLGDVFSADGIVGTPFEERARFVHAMNEELSHTISGISGVRSARVHIMLPEVTRYRTVEDPARASIIIHVENDFAEDQFLPTIKNLVAHSIANLEYESVSVAVFPVNGPVIAPNTPRDQFGVANAANAGRPMQLVPLNTHSSNMVNLNVVILLLGLIAISWVAAKRIARKMRMTWRKNA